MAWRHRTVYKRLGSVTPGFVEFHKRPMEFGMWRRSRLEIRAMLEARAMRASAGVFVLSRRCAAELSALYHVEAEVIRGCLKAGAYPSPITDIRAKYGLPLGPIYLSVSRLERVKRIDLLIRVLHHVRDRIPRASLVIVGTGPEAAVLGELAKSLRLETVVFAGYVREEELGDYYAASDLFLAPATADFNIAPYEAVARGLPAIVSDELEIEGWILRSGWITQARPTVDGFAQSMVEFLGRKKPAPIDLTPLSWEARVERILDYLARHSMLPSYRNDHRFPV
jgi:glycosyltransferase involved in cell wall biosynthesis